MNIWQWFRETQVTLRENGHHRTAEMLQVLPTYVCDGRHEEVDAIVPEALAAVRALKNPWLEVFVRHWHLQSTVLKRCEVKTALPEAVDLLEFSTRENTKECPQSICVVQDLSNCYGEADGPGYAQERIDVASETLARIDPSWPCYSCISAELVSAMNDADRAEEALDTARAAVVALDGKKTQLRGSIVQSLIELGRLEEALAENDDPSAAVEGDSFELARRIDEARVLAKLERYEEALEALPAFDDVDQSRSEYAGYSDALTTLAIAGVIDNDWQLGLLFKGMHAALERHGSMRNAFIIAQRRAHLALARRAYLTVEDSLRDMSRIAEGLHRPIDAPERTEVIVSLLAERRKEAPAIAPEELTDAIMTLGEDPERDRETLAVLERAEPLDGERLRVQGAALWTLGHHDEAIEKLEASFAANPMDEETLHALASVLSDHGDLDKLEKLVDAVQARGMAGQQIANIRVALSKAAWSRGDADAARKQLKLAIADDPPGAELRRWLAEVERAEGNWEEALEILEKLVAEELADDDTQWERALAATMLEKHDIVRDAAIALELPVEAGDTPIDERWGTCLVYITDDAGRAHTILAGRTGPVTARVLEILPPDGPQFFEDRVVFDPAPRTRAEDEDGYDEYQVVHVASKGGFSAYAMDGIRPEADAEQALRDALDEVGAQLQVASDESYAIEQDEDLRPAWFGLIAVPEGGADVVAKVLADANLPEPHAYPELVRATGDDERLAQQNEWIEQYGLM